MQQGDSTLKSEKADSSIPNDSKVNSQVREVKWTNPRELNDVGPSVLNEVKKYSESTDPNSLFQLYRYSIKYETIRRTQFYQQLKQCIDFQKR